jgi:hypothetical protein
MDIVQKIPTIFYNMTIHWPMRALFLQGPPTVGMWGGLPSADICARLTRVQAEFWLSSNMEECDTLIERECYSWSILLIVLIYVYMVFKCMGNLIDRMFRVQNC